jgi:hypothetical protein
MAVASVQISVITSANQEFDGASARAQQFDGFGV